MIYFAFLSTFYFKIKINQIVIHYFQLNFIYCSDSVSPAFLIRINASLDYNETENIYEEINETRTEKTSGDSIRAIFRRAKDTVKRNSRNMDESSFHMSISKGRKQTLKERINVDWDDDEENSGGLPDLKNTSKGLNSLKLDIEVIKLYRRSFTKHFLKKLKYHYFFFYLEIDKLL